MADKDVYINVELGLNSKEFEKELDDLEKNIDPIQIPAEFKLDEVTEVVKSAANVVKEINKAIAGISSIEGLISSGGTSAVEAGLKDILASINKRISSAISGVTNFLLAPIKETFSGIFTQLGMSISQSFSSNLVQTIEKGLNVSMEQVGQLAGDRIGNLIKKIFSNTNQSSGTPPSSEEIPDLYKQIFKQTATASGVKNFNPAMLPKISTNLEEGAAAKYSQNTNTVHLSKSDYAKLKSGKIDLLGIDNLAHEFRHALQLNFGQQGKALGVNLLRGTQKELDKLNDQISASTNAASKGQSAEVIAKIRRLETDAYVFASRNAEKIYNAISGKGSSLSDSQKQAKADIIKSQERVRYALNKENALALEQLTKSQLLQIAKGSGVTGTNGLRVADLRNKLLNTVNPDELGFKIPTFSKPGKEIAALSQSLLSQPIEGIKSTINAFSLQMKGAIADKGANSASLRKALDSIQTQRQTYAAALAQDIDKETRNAIQAAIARLGKQRIALQSRLTIANSQSLNQRGGSGSYIPQGVDLYSMAPRTGAARLAPAFQNAYGQAGNRLYNDPRLAGMGEVERRSVVAEAGGYIFSGAAMAAPIQTAIASLAPIAIPLTPIIATGALVANVISPILAAVQDTLQKVEPIRRRFESIAGKEGGKQESDFARSVANEFGTSTLTSLESYSQLFAATKNTSLEGENTRELFKGISAAVKALGMDSESARLTMYAFTQMASKGVISMEELRQQLGEKFPPALNLFAKAAGVSQADLGKLVESGKLLSSDILPKVAKQLQLQYGGAAKSSVNDFISSQIRLENSIFKFQEKLAEAFGPLLSGLTSTFSGFVDFVGNNMETITKIFGVALIGLGAQFLVGTTVILSQLEIITTAIAAIVPIFGAAFATLTPMFVGIATDMMDDVLGVTSAFENISLGFYNFFASAATVVIAGMDKMSELFNGVTFAASKTVNVLDMLGNAFKAIRSVVPNVVIELVALTLMLNQTAALTKLALLPIIADMYTALRTLGVSFIAAARSGKIFQVVMSTLSAGLNLTQVATMGALAAFLLFFSKAKFTNEVGSQFDKLTDTVTSGSEKMQKALGAVGKGMEAIKLKTDGFKSQGFDLTVGLGEQFGGGSYRTDDVIKLLRGDEEMKKLLKEGKITQQEFDKFMDDAASDATTFAEKVYQDNLIKLQDLDDEIKNVVDATGILNDTFKNNELGKSIDSVKNIDPQIKALQQQRVDLVSREDANTNKAIKEQVTALDAKIKALLTQRESSVQSFKTVQQELDKYSADIKAQIEAIDKRSDIPKSAKEELKFRLNSTLSVLEIARNKLKKVGVDLVPNLGVDFQKVSQDIENGNASLERSLNKVKRTLAADNLSLQSLLNKGSISQQTFDSASLQAERISLAEKIEDLDDYIETRKSQIKQLMLLPSPTKDQKDLIDKNQKLVLEKEQELLQTTVELEKKKYDQQKRVQEQKLKDFDEAEQIEESHRKAGLVDEQQSIESLLVIRQMKGREELAQIAEKRKKLNKADKQGLEALAVQEAVVLAKMADNRKARFDEQFTIVKAASDRSLAYLEARRKQGLTSEQQAAVESISIAQTSANGQLLLIRQRMKDIPKANKFARAELLVQEQQALAQIAEARKTAHTAAISAVKSKEETELAVTSALRSQGVLSEQQYNRQQYDEKSKALEEQVRLIQERRAELNAADVDGLRELDKQEADLYRQRSENQKAFLDSQLQQLEKQQQKAKDIVAESTKEREIEVQKLVNERVLNQEEATKYLTQIAKDGIKEELEAEDQKLRTLQNLKYTDPIAEEDRQTKIRQSRIRTSELTLQLLQNEKQQQEAVFAAISKAYDRVNQNIANGATRFVQPLERQLRLSNALEKSFDIQNKLLDARKGLYAALQNYVNADLQILQDTADTEEEKKQLAEAAASAKLQAARIQVEIDRQSLELQIKQTDAAQRRLEIENAIAQIKNKADTAQKQANLSKVKADPNATQEQVDAAQLDLQASIAEGLGLKEQSSILGQERTANAQINDARRRTQQLEGDANIRKAEYEAANAIANERDKQFALNQLREKAARSLLGTNANNAQNMVEDYNLSNRGYALAPLQEFFASQVRSAIAPRLPELILPQVQASNEFTSNVDNFGAAVNTLMDFVSSKLASPTQVTITAPITNNIDSRNTGNVDVAGQFRKQLFDLGLELNRKS